MEQSKVSIDLMEYNEFVISQYENGKIKTSLLDEIKTLKKDLNELIETHANQVSINQDYKPKKSIIIEMLFRKHSMGSDSRKEQTDLMNDRIGNYAGIHKNDVPKLLELGISKTEMVDYINTQWDIKDAADKIKKEETEEKERLAALELEGEDAK